jgi:phenylalanyl-tRNA synthetase beta chain
MIFSYSWLQSFFKEKLPEPESLAELLTLHSFEVKEVGKKEGDYFLDIDVLPNRASDCFSHIGIAREISAILGKKLVIPSLKIKENTKKKIGDFLDFSIKKEICNRYSAKLVLGVKVQPSPYWLVKRLNVCGIKSINNIVDVTNFVMLETGQPLHAFDLDKISGAFPKKIFVKKAKKGEKVITLDGEEYELDEEIPVICDTKKILAIAGIKGAKGAEIDAETKNIFLESANFNRLLIRRASRKLDLKTDASLRFEHGLDPNLTVFAIERAVSLLKEVSQGESIKEIKDFYPKKIFPLTISISLQKLNTFFGTEIEPEKIIKIIKRLQFKIISKQKNYLTVEVPTFRQDIKREEDIFEEIVRLYGLNKINPVFLPAFYVLPKENLDVFWEKRVTDFLKEMRMKEVYNYSFIGEKEKEIFQFKNLIEIENPISNRFLYLRPSLLPHLLNNVKLNQKFFENIKIFELGKVFLEKEKKKLAGVINKEGFLELKGIVHSLFETLGISSLWYDEYQPKIDFSFWHPKRVAEIKVDNEIVGILGEISPLILEKMGIKNRVTAFEIDFDLLSKIASEEVIYQPYSVYPALIRDLSILVPRETLVEEVIGEIESEGKDLLLDVDLFDIFESEDNQEGKKSLAFHLVFQKKSGPISTKEVEDCLKSIIKRLESHEDWEVRK